MFDRVFVQPSALELLEGFRQAQHRANARGFFPLRDHGFWVEQCDQVFARPEGALAWLHDAYSLLNEYEMGRVAVAWWTDYLGRRHVRVQGHAQRGPTGWHGINIEDPPLFAVYPQVAMWRNVGSRREAWVWCRCGERGPLSLGKDPGTKLSGWMGPCCAACHDRQQEGEPLPQLTDELGLARVPIPDHEEVGPGLVYDFSPDGQLLATLSEQGRLCIRERASCRVQLDIQTRQGEALRFRPVRDNKCGQQLAVLSANEVRLWNWVQNRWRPGLSFGDAWDVAWSPDGQRLALAGQQQVRLWHQGRIEVWGGLPVTRRLPPYPNGRPDALAFTADGKNVTWLAQSELSYERNTYRLQRYGTAYWNVASFTLPAGIAFLSADGRWAGIAGESVQICATGVNVLLGSIPWPDYTPGTRTARFSPDGLGLIQRTPLQERLVPWLHLLGVKG
ncbi:MAG: WD40 repeat domain-containing protein [Gemmataceae bacterium]